MTETKNVPKLRFNEFIDNWEFTKLKFTGNIITGTTPSTVDKSNFDDYSYMFVTPGDIDDFKFVEKTERYLSDKGLKKGREIPKDSVLVTCIGATIGKICMIKKVGSCNQQINAIIPNEKYYSHFIYYSIQKNDKKLKMYAGNTATPILNKKSFGNLSFNFPSLNEQRKIADFLSLIDKKIELLEKKLSLYQSLKNDLPNKIFNKSLEFKDKNGSTEYKWGELELKNVLIEFNKKVGLKFNYPILSSTLSGIYFQEDYFNGNVNSQNLEEYKLVPRGYFTYRSMSDTGVFKFNIQNITDMGIISPAYPVFNVKNINKYYLYDYLNYSADIKKQILKIKEGGTRYALSFSKFKKLTVKTPPIEIQNKISNIIYYYNLKHTKIENEKNLLLKYKKGLLQQMFI